MSSTRFLTPARLKAAGGVALLLASGYCITRQQEKKDKKKPQRKSKQIVSQAEVSKCLSVLLKKLYAIGGSKIAGLALLAMVRTALTNYQGRLQGQLFETAFLKRVPDFVRIIVINMGMCVASSTVESTSRFLLDSLAIQWRGWMTRMLHSKYFSHMAYYQMSYVDRRIGDAEHVLCDDVQQFTAGLADLTGELTVAAVDALFYGTALRVHRGTHGYLAAMAAYIVSAGTLTAALAPNFSRLVSKTQELESRYKASQETVRGTVEPLALLRGMDREATGVRAAFAALVSHTGRVLSAQFAAGVTSDFLLKYSAATAAVIMIIGPFFGATTTTMAARARMLSDMRYHTSIVIAMFSALGALANSPRKWHKLRGFVQRIAAMDRVVADVHAAAHDLAVHGADESLNPALPPPPDTAAAGVRSDMRRSGSRVASDAEEISFEKVTVVTPADTVLVRDLSVRVPAGTNLLVTGPNGAGKSSLFRVLGGLWPAESGVVRKPDAAEAGLSHHIFYVPQRPYVVKGTLLEQLMYPLPPDAGHGCLTELQARSLLEEVDLEHLVERHGFHTPAQWNEELSLGEQQRLGIARLMFHRPTFAILDECTSAVTTDMERRFTDILRRLGCTCITISHRPALVAFHDLVLALDGDGGWQLLPGQRRRNGDAALGGGGGGGGRRGGDADAVRAAMAAGMATTAAVDAGAASRRIVAGVRPEAGTTVSSAATASLHAALMRERLAGARETLPRGWPQWARILEALYSPVGMWTHVRQLAAIGGIVLLRTLLQDRIARLNGRTVEYMLRQNLTAFRSLIAISIAQALGSAVLAPLLRFKTDALALEWRKRLTARALQHYLSEDTAYATVHLGGMADAEQRMTTDTRQLAAGLAQLVPTFVKPLVDTLWFSWHMGRLTGMNGILLLYGYSVAGFAALRALTPDFGTLSSRAMALEADFRKAHHYLKQHAESVAFFGGAGREAAAIGAHLGALLEQHRAVARARWLHSIVDDLFTKQLPHNATWALTLLYALQRPDSAWADAEAQGATVFDMRYLATIVANCFLAFGEILQMNTRVHELSAGVARVAQLLCTTEAAEGLQRELTATNISGCCASDAEPQPLLDVKGLSVVTPSGATLAKHVTLRVHAGEDLLVTGPNGSGKSSLVRILRGLWPNVRGSIAVAGGPAGWRSIATVFYVPQQPYLGSSSLLEQLIFPLSLDDALERLGHPRGKLSGKADVLQQLHSQCMAIMQQVKLGYLVVREGGWGTAKHWSTTLSLGEQQRMGMGRLFFHRPLVAVLDECTNATSVEVEERLFQHAKSLGITIITVTQRPALTKLYKHELKLLDGNGHWELCELENMSDSA